MDAFRREIHGWHSQRTGMHMPIVQYGHWGRPLLLLPTAAADYLEAERKGLIDAVRRHVVAGKVRIFSIEGVNQHAWMNDSVSFPEKSARQAAWVGYVEEEVVPYIRGCLQNPEARLAVGGASFGAFHAANLFFRRPALWDTLLGMSGLYDLSSFLNGYSDEQVYLNNPAWFVPKLDDPKQLELIRSAQIHIVTGQGAWEYPNLSKEFSSLLWSKGIAHNLDLWGHDIPHEWWSWHLMLEHYLGNKLGW
jgi:esterase/lipase superfamily enzyme